MFKRKPKSTPYMRGLTYAEELHQDGMTLAQLYDYMEVHVVGGFYERFDCGFRDFLHVLKMREFTNAT